MQQSMCVHSRRPSHKCARYSKRADGATVVESEARCGRKVYLCSHESNVGAWGTGIDPALERRWKESATHAGAPKASNVARDDFNVVANFAKAIDAALTDVPVTRNTLFASFDENALVYVKRAFSLLDRGTSAGATLVRGVPRGGFVHRGIQRSTQNYTNAKGEEKTLVVYSKAPADYVTPIVNRKPSGDAARNAVAKPSREPEATGFFRYRYDAETDKVVVKGSSAGVRLGARVEYAGGFWTVVGSNKLTVYLEPYTAPTASNAVPGVHKVTDRHPLAETGPKGERYYHGPNKRPWLDAVADVYPEGAMSPIRIRVPRADILATIPWVERPMRVRGSAHGTRTGTVAGRPVYGHASDAFDAFIEHVVNLRHSTGETFSRCARCGGDYCPSMRGRFQQRSDGRWELSRWGRCPATFDGPTKAAEKHSRRCVATRTAEVLVGRNPARHR